MKRFNVLGIYIVTVIILLTVQVKSMAAIPDQVSYQGQLTDSKGNNVPDGTYTIKFAIYSTATDTKPLWSETQTLVQVVDGVFSTLLPSNNTNIFPDDLFEKGLYVGITVNKDEEMKPRLLLAATPFAFLAQDSDKLGGYSLSGLDTRYVNSSESSSITSSMIVNGTITGDDLAESYVSADSLPYNQPFQWDDYQTSEISGPTSLATGVSCPLVPEGKRLVIQYVSLNLSSTGIDSDPVCDVDVIDLSSGHSSWIVTHTLQPVKYERAYSRISYIFSGPITLYADPGSKIQVGCSAHVTEDTTVRAALTGYFVDLSE